LHRATILLSLIVFFLACRSIDERRRLESKVLASQAPRSQYLEDHENAVIRDLGHDAVGIGLRLGESLEPYTAGKPFCSGMIHSYQGQRFVLTAAHCNKEAGRAKIDSMPYFSGSNPLTKQTQGFALKSAILVDHRIDLALLAVDLPDELEGLPFVMKEARVGMAVVGIGHPMGDFKKVFDQCEVSSVGAPFIFTHDCKTVLGSSGSVILDQGDLSLLGVVSAGSGGGTESSSTGSRIAVHSYPLRDIVQASLDATEVLGYALDSPDGGYHFLAFNGQVHCPRNSGLPCREEMLQITQFLGELENLKILQKHFPANWQAFDAFQSLGFLVRLRSGGEPKVNGNIIDYVYTSPQQSFAELFRQWVDLNQFP
jgi:hypothetical protein